MVYGQVDYGDAQVPEKVLAIETSGVMTLETAAEEMEAVSEQNTRLRTPADVHLMLSWREGELPTNEQAFAAGRHVLKALNLDQHQYVMAIHQDTENRHVHIAVSRVHPETYRAVDLYRDYEKIHRACEEMEIAQGWSHENHMDPETPRRVSGKHHGRIDDMRAWSDQVPFVDRVKMIAPDLQAVLASENPTWKAVHARLAEHHVRLEPKGSGFIVVDRNDPSLIAKASDIGRFASKSRLEAILGAFEPDTYLQQEAQKVERVIAQSPDPVFGYGQYLYQRDTRYREEQADAFLSEPERICDELTKTQAIFTEKDLERFLGQEFQNVEQAKLIMQQLDRYVHEKKIVELEYTSEERCWTTAAQLAIEAQFLSAIDKLQANSTASTQHHHEGLESYHLTPGQLAALQRHLSGERLVAIEGYAGSGKSYLFGTMAKLAPERTYIGLCQGGQQAADLQKSTGITSMTIASFLRLHESGHVKLNSLTDLIIDEANMIGVHEFNDLLQIAVEHGCRVRVAGDRSQLAGVAAGGAFSALLERAQTTSLADVIRLDGWYREAAEYARSRDTIARAVSLYCEHGRTHETATNDEAIIKTVDLWEQGEAEIEQRLIVSYRNEDVDILNLEARQRLLQSKRITESTTIQLKQGLQFEVGIGERVVFRKNDYEHLHVKNGSLGTVTGIQNGRLTVKLDDDQRSILVDTRTYHHIGYGYASTFYAAEGKTVEHTYWMATRADSRNSAYVAMSRAKTSTDIIYSQKEFAFHFKRFAQEQNYLRNLTFLLKRNAAKDFASAYTQSNTGKTISEQLSSSNIEKQLSQELSTESVAKIRRHEGDLKYHQWIVQHVGSDVRKMLSAGSEEQSWSRFHAILQANDVKLHMNENGASYRDTHHSRWSIRSSLLPKDLQFPELVRVLGAYQDQQCVQAEDIAKACVLRSQRLAAEQETLRRQEVHAVERAPKDVQQLHREYGHRVKEQEHTRFQRESDREISAQRHHAIDHAKRDVYAFFRTSFGMNVQSSLAYRDAWVRQERMRANTQVVERDSSTIPSWRAFIIEQQKQGNALAQTAYLWLKNVQSRLKENVMQQDVKISQVHSDVSQKSQTELRAETNNTTKEYNVALSGNQVESGIAETIETSSVNEEREKTVDGTTTRHSDDEYPDKDTETQTTPVHEVIEEALQDEVEVQIQQPVEPNPNHSKEHATKPESSSSPEENSVETDIADITQSAESLSKNTIDHPIERRYQGMSSDQLNGHLAYRNADIIDRVLKKYRFIDMGDKVRIVEHSNDSIALALRHAQEKWGDQEFRITGSAKSLDRIQVQAAQMGIRIKGSQHEINIEPVRKIKVEPEKQFPSRKNDRGIEF